MIYMPAVLVVGFYFERWRALATGLALCGSGVGTFVLSPLTKYLLTSYSWATTLVVHAGVNPSLSLVYTMGTFMQNFSSLCRRLDVDV